MDYLGWLIVGAFVVGMSKGGLASAAAVVVPALALTMGPIQAAALLLPVYIVTDWVAVWLYRRDFSARNVAILAPAMLAGTLVSTLAIPYVAPELLLLVTGLIGLWYCGRNWLGGGHGPARPARILPGLFWGVLTGISSFITHSGSPPSQAYLLPQRLPKLELAGTIAIIFAIGNLSKLPGYWALGQFDDIDWHLLAYLAVAGIAGTAAGRWLVARLSDRAYIRVIEAMLFALSLLLIWKGLVPFL